DGRVVAVVPRVAVEFEIGEAHAVGVERFDRGREVAERIPLDLGPATEHQAVEFERDRPALVYGPEQRVARREVPVYVGALLAPLEIAGAWLADGDVEPAVRGDRE